MKAARKREPVRIGPEGPGAQLEQQLQLQQYVLEMIRIGLTPGKTFSISFADRRSTG